MTILNRKMHLHNLTELQRRKTELKAQIEQEKAALQETVKDIRAEWTPGNLLRKGLTGLWQKEDKGKGAAEAPEATPTMSAPLQMLVDVLVSDRRLASLIKNVAPVVVAAVPKMVKKAGEAIPEKVQVYGNLKKRISGWRNRLKSKKSELPDRLDEVTDEDVIEFEGI